MSEENVNLSWVREVNSWVEAYNYLNDKYALRHALMALLVGVTRELCYEIEKLPPSEQQTKVSVIAADLSREIKSIVDLKRGSETVYPSSEIVLAYRKARMDLEYPEEERGLTQHLTRLQSRQNAPLKNCVPSIMCGTQHRHAGNANR